MRELQDLYDIHRNFTGEQFYRGDSIPEDRYRLGVQVWVRNEEGKFLLSQRHPCKKKPLLWEATGGAVDAGEDTLTAAVREVGEELGLKIKKSQLVLLKTTLCDGIEFLDTYLACWNGEISELQFQENEVVDAKWVTYEEMQEMDARGELCVEYQSLFEHVRSVPAAVCPMTIEDYDEMVAMWQRIPGMGLNDVDDSREGVQQFLSRNPGMSFVVKNQQGIAGTAMAGHDGRRGHLYHVAVLPAARGCGFGKALVQASLNALRRNGVSKVGLQVFADNEIGNQFWDSLGFADRTDVKYRSCSLTKMNVVITKQEG